MIADIFLQESHRKQCSFSLGWCAPKWSHCVWAEGAGGGMGPQPHHYPATVTITALGTPWLCNPDTAPGPWLTSLWGWSLYPAQGLRGLVTLSAPLLVVVPSMAATGVAGAPSQWKTKGKDRCSEAMNWCLAEPKHACKFLTPKTFFFFFNGPSVSRSCCIWPRPQAWARVFCKSALLILISVWLTTLFWKGKRIKRKWKWHKRSKINKQNKQSFIYICQKFHIYKIHLIKPICVGFIRIKDDTVERECDKIIAMSG